jgi:predicted dehydrogenase
MGRLRIAVVGIGKMGLLHAGILSSLPNIELVALCDKTAMILRFARKVFAPTGVKVLNDIEKLAGLDLDVAYVTTPISSHAAIARELYATETARNVFVEKTLATNYEEARGLCELAQRAKGVNMVGYMKRFAVTFRKAKDLLDKKALGEISSFDVYAYSSDFLGVDADSKASASRGEALRDLGCHAIDLALWFFGGFQVESLRPKPTTNETSDLVCFTVGSSGGVKGQFRVSRSMEGYRYPEICFSIVGSMGTLRVNDDKLDLRQNEGKSFTWYRHDLGDNVNFWLGEAEYFREDQHFVRSILDGHGAKPDFCTASKVDRVIDDVKTQGGNR